MKKTIKVLALTEWKDVTLKKYLHMMADIEAYKDDEDAVTALMLHHLAGIPYEEMSNLSAESFNMLKEKISKFLKPEDMELQKFVTIGNTEYGFEPNLSKMTYGAYADISQYDTISIDKNWAKIMSILYRPVTKKEKHGLYQIEKYTGVIDDKVWLDVTMDIHFGTLFFFLNLQMDLMKDTLKSLTETEFHPNINTILEESGEAIQRYSNLLKETSKK
jgi:hypothetical protein